MTATINILTLQQISDLQILFSQTYAEFERDKSQRGLWVDVYEALYDLITDFNFNNTPKPGVDPQSWVWLRGARYVNGGVGPFAALIRDYTIIQHRLRYGEDATDIQMDTASNQIAVRFLAQWLGFEVTGVDTISNVDSPPPEFRGHNTN